MLSSKRNRLSFFLFKPSLTLLWKTQVRPDYFVRVSLLIRLTYAKIYALLKNGAPGDLKEGKNVQIYHSHIPININDMFQKQNIWYLPWIKSQTFRLHASVETAIEYDYRNEWPIVVTCYKFMMLGYMGEAHRDGLPVQFMILFDFDISAWMLQFYIQRVNWSSHSLFTMCIRKCNITALIFFKGSECWGGA